MAPKDSQSQPEDSTPPPEETPVFSPTSEIIVKGFSAEEIPVAKPSEE
jgi:hypothetical protein